MDDRSTKCDFIFFFLGKNFFGESEIVYTRNIMFTSRETCQVSSC